MKTFKAILKEYAWGRSVTFTDAQSEVIDKAMKEYGGHIVDRCAEVAQTETVRASSGDPCDIVDRESILKVKRELK